MKNILITILFLSTVLNCVSQKTEKKLGKNHDLLNCKCPSSFEINEISKLTHIKGKFYRNEKGHLYIKTNYSAEPISDQSLPIEYFSSLISQRIDVETFKPFDEGLTFTYAKDKNNIYYCQPTSSGNHIWLIKNADLKTFKLLQTTSELFAADKNRLYRNEEILLKFKPNKTKFKRNKKGEITEFIQGNLRYKIE